MGTSKDEKQPIEEPPEFLDLPIEMENIVTGEPFWDAQGNLVEKRIQEFIESKGIRAEKLFHYYNKKTHILREPEIRAALAGNKTLADKLIADLKEVTNNTNNGLPDLMVVSKDSTVSFVECKSNTSKLEDSQKQVFPLLEKKGYRIEVIHMSIKLHVFIENTTIYDYKKHQEMLDLGNKLKRKGFA